MCSILPLPTDKRKSRTGSGETVEPQSGPTARLLLGTSWSGGSLPVVLAIQEVDDQTLGKNRLHLDFGTEDLDAEVDRLLGAGARWWPSEATRASG
jgi:hypothetical protein